MLRITYCTLKTECSGQLVCFLTQYIPNHNNQPARCLRMYVIIYQHACVWSVQQSSRKESCSQLHTYLVDGNVTYYMNAHMRRSTRTWSATNIISKRCVVVVLSVSVAWSEVTYLHMSYIHIVYVHANNIRASQESLHVQLLNSHIPTNVVHILTYYINVCPSKYIDTNT